MNRNAWLTAVMVLIVLGTLAGLVAISERYPFYFIWDMDQTTALDVALINAGKHPDHLNHTSIGMYAVMRATSFIAMQLRLITTANYDILAQALNPLFPVAEITTFLRLHSPVVIVAAAIAGFASVAIATGMRVVSIAGLAVLALLLSQTWTIYHAAYIRSETYALLFWELGLLSFAVAALTRSFAHQLARAMLSGALVGVALMTKLQLLPYLCAYYLIAKIMLDLRQAEAPAADEAGAGGPSLTWAIAINAAGLLIFALLWIASANYSFTSGYFVMSNASDTARYSVGPAALLFVAIGLALIAVQSLYGRVGWLRQLFSKRELAVFSAIQAGYALSAFIPLALYSRSRTGWELTRANFKVAFLREFEGPGVLSTLAVMGGNVRGWVLQYPLLAAATVLAWLAIAALAFVAPSPRERWLCARILLWTSGIIAIFLIGSVFFRFYVRDIIWHEALVTLLVALLLCIAAGVARRCWPESSRLSAAIVVVPAAILVAANVAAYPSVQQKNDLNFNIYGWSASHAFLHVYTGNQLLYRDLMRARFNDQRIAPDSTAGIALRQAVEWRDVQRTAAFVLPYQRVPLTSIGVFARGGMIAPDGQKLVEVPEALSGAIVIDLGGLRDGRRRRLLEGNLVSGETEDFDKITAVSASGRMGVAPRSDLEIVQFAARRGDAPCELRATAARPGEPPATFCGVPVKRYIEIDRASGPPGFLAIRRVFGW
jgi:hypothetical protein